MSENGSGSGFKVPTMKVDLVILDGCLQFLFFGTKRRIRNFHGDCFTQSVTLRSRDHDILFYMSVLSFLNGTWYTV